MILLKIKYFLVSQMILRKSNVNTIKNINCNFEYKGR